MHDKVSNTQRHQLYIQNCFKMARCRRFYTKGPAEPWGTGRGLKTCTEMQREVSVGTSQRGSCLLGPSCERPGSQEGGKPEGHHPFPRLLLRGVDRTAQNFPARGGAGARLRMTASRPGVLTGTPRPSREPHRSRQDLRPVWSAKGHFREIRRGRQNESH